MVYATDKTPIYHIPHPWDKNILVVVLSKQSPGATLYNTSPKRISREKSAIPLFNDAPLDHNEGAVWLLRSTFTVWCRGLEWARY